MNYKMVLLVHPVFLFRLSVQQHHLAPTSKKTVLEQQLSAAHLQKNKANTQYNADNVFSGINTLKFSINGWWCVSEVLLQRFIKRSFHLASLVQLTGGPWAPAKPWGPGEPASPFWPGSPTSPLTPGWPSGPCENVNNTVKKTSNIAESVISFTSAPEPEMFFRK